MADATTSSDEPQPGAVDAPVVPPALDTVIQRLFAAGLTVQSVAASLPDDERGMRLTSAVQSIDTTIREVRVHMEQTATTGPADAVAPVGGGRE